MNRKQFHKAWRDGDLGIRTVAILPAWNPGDQVEVIGTGLVGVIIEHAAANYSRWRVLLGPGGESEVEVGARDLRVPV